MRASLTATGTLIHSTISRDCRRSTMKIAIIINRAMHLTQAAGNRLSPRNSFRRYWAEIDSFLHQPQEQQSMRPRYSAIDAEDVLVHAKAQSNLSQVRSPITEFARNRARANFAPNALVHQAVVGARAKGRATD